MQTLEAMEGTLNLNWKRAERRVKIDRSRTISFVRARVPEDSHDVIAAAL